ncbi:MAG: ankyrin repeat domain-containing protein [Oscillospiraceae bacterium]|nr:ankyrin repeat domain-containing protein [Oscillospiraceae bacterium]
MGGISVLLLQGLFLILLVLAVVGAIGLITLITGIIINIRSLIKKKKKSIPAIVTIIIGSVLMIPITVLLVWGTISTIHQNKVDREAMGELAYSIEQNDMSKLDTLLSNGANPNVDITYFGNQDTPLGVAYAKGNMEAIKKLLDAGANPNTVDKNGNSLLLIGLEWDTNEESNNYIARAKLLIDYGADVKVKSKNGIVDENATTLILLADNASSSIATSDEFIELANILLEKGVDINAQNSNGETALIKACNSVKPNTDFIKFLLEKGADKNITDDWIHADNPGVMYNALDYFKKVYEDSTYVAKDDNYYEILKMLE